MSAINFQKIQIPAYKLAHWGVILMALSSPLSRAAFNIGVGLLIIGWIFSSDFYRKWQEVKTSYISLAIIFFFSIVCISTIYSSANPNFIWTQLRTYGKLLYIPFIITIWRKDNSQDMNLLKYARKAFILSFVILVFAVYFNIILSTQSSNFSMYKGVFYHRIAQGMMLSYSTLWALQKTYQKMKCKKYLSSSIFGILFLLSFASVFYFNHARAAHLGLFFGMLTCIIILFRGKWLFLILPATFVFLSVIAIKSPAISSRFATAWGEIQNFQIKKQENTSVGARLKVWEGSIELWKERPILGHGVGSYKKWAYSNINKKTCGMGVCDQPHNQYLVIASELGIVGLLGLLGIIVAPLIKTKYRLQSTHVLLWSFSTVFWVMALTDSTLIIDPYLFFYIMAISLLLLDDLPVKLNGNYLKTPPISRQ